MVSIYSTPFLPVPLSPRVCRQDPKVRPLKCLSGLHRWNVVQVSSYFLLLWEETSGEPLGRHLKSVANGSLDRTVYTTVGMSKSRYLAVIGVG